MASGFQAANRALSRLLLAEAEAVGVFGHKSALGDGREALVRRFLAERVGATFGVTKAEVVDSYGATSGELDVVIYDQRVASCLSVLGERRIVRAEAVAVTIEVKSRFDPSTARAESIPSASWNRATSASVQRGTVPPSNAWPFSTSGRGRR